MHTFIAAGILATALISGCTQSGTDAGNAAPADAVPGIAAPADTPAAGAGIASTTTAPDGSYRCHKISPGGQLLDIGDLEIDDGEASMAGMPENWTVLSVTSKPNPDGSGPLVILLYRSASGFNDQLDCVPN